LMFRDVLKYFHMFDALLVLSEARRGNLWAAI